MASDTPNPSRGHLAKFQDTLTSKVGPDTPGRRSSPEIDVVSSGPTLEMRISDLEQRLGSCEMRIDGVYERLAKLERERSDNLGQRQRLMRVVFLWVGLVSLFIVIWTFWVRAGGETAMLFVFGTKDDERERGFVVDRCAECHTLRWLRVIDRFSVWHVYFVPIGRGNLEASTCQCTDCGTTSAFRAERYAEVLPAIAAGPLEAALERTTPELAQKLERLDRLQNLESDPPYRGVGDAGQSELLSSAIRRLRGLELGGIDSGPWLARVERWPRLSPSERELLAAELNGYAQALGVS